MFEIGEVEQIYGWETRDISLQFDDYDDSIFDDEIEEF